MTKGCLLWAAAERAVLSGKCFFGTSGMLPGGRLICILSPALRHLPVLLGVKWLSTEVVFPVFCFFEKASVEKKDISKKIEQSSQPTREKSDNDLK